MRRIAMETYVPTQRLVQQATLTVLLLLSGVSFASVVSVGAGGGGDTFAPTFSPFDSGTMFIACDLGGLYRSTDSGNNWTMLNRRDVGAVDIYNNRDTANPRLSVAFDPNISGHIIAMQPTVGLKESFDNGNTWSAYTWTGGQLLPNLDVTSVGFSLDSSRLHIGTTKGVFTITNGAGRLSLDGTAPVWEQRVLYPDGTDAGSTANAREVINFVSVRDSAGVAVDFVATLTDIWQYDGAQNWTAMGPSAPSRPPAPYWYFYSGSPKPYAYNASRIRGFAGGYISGARYVLYVTITTDQTLAQDNLGGVYRYVRSLARTPTAWTQEIAGLGSDPRVPACSNIARPVYELLGVASNAPDTAYVTVVQTTCSPDVYKRTFGSEPAWHGVYNGYYANPLPPSYNLDPGWTELNLPFGLSWGFGGKARGFNVAPTDSSKALFTNAAAVHITTGGASIATNWRRAYTNLASGTVRPPPPSNPRWRTNGVDVTNVHDYAIHPDPTKANIHFILNTDVGLLRSDDGDSSWSPVIGIDGVWGNIYQLAFEYPDHLPQMPSRIWAAVSNQHDIPYETQLSQTPGGGTILVSNDDGVT